MTELNDKQIEVRDGVMDTIKQFEGELSVLEMAEVLHTFSCEFTTQAFENTKTVDPSEFEEMQSVRTE